MPVTAVRDEGALRMWVCRLPVHIALAKCTVFTVIFGEFAIFLGRQNAPVFTETSGESAASQWADVGIGPYDPVGKCIRIRRMAVALCRRLPLDLLWGKKNA